MTGEIEFQMIVDELEVAGTIITADLRLIFSGSTPAHPITLESVRRFTGETVPTFVWDACSLWTNENQSKLQELLTNEILNREEDRAAYSMAAE